MPVIIEFSRCISTYSSAKFEFIIFTTCNCDIHYKSPFSFKYTALLQASTYKNEKFDIKNAGFMRPASTFFNIQLSNSRIKIYLLHFGVFRKLDFILQIILHCFHGCFYILQAIFCTECGKKGRFLMQLVWIKRFLYWHGWEKIRCWFIWFISRSFTEFLKSYFGSCSKLVIDI